MECEKTPQRRQANNARARSARTIRRPSRFLDNQGDDGDLSRKDDGTIQLQGKRKVDSAKRILEVDGIKCLTNSECPISEGKIIVRTPKRSENVLGKQEAKVEAESPGGPLMESPVMDLFPQTQQQMYQNGTSPQCNIVWDCNSPQYRDSVAPSTHGMRTGGVFHPRRSQREMSTVTSPHCGHMCPPKTMAADTVTMDSKGASRVNNGEFTSEAAVLPYKNPKKALAGIGRISADLQSIIGSAACDGMGEEEEKEEEMFTSEKKNATQAEMSRNRLKGGCEFEETPSALDSERKKDQSEKDLDLWSEDFKDEDDWMLAAAAAERMDVSENGRQQLLTRLPPVKTVPKAVGKTPTSFGSNSRTHSPKSNPQLKGKRLVFLDTTIIKTNQKGKENNNQTHKGPVTSSDRVTATSIVNSKLNRKELSKKSEPGAKVSPQAGPLCTSTSTHTSTAAKSATKSNDIAEKKGHMREKDEWEMLFGQDSDDMIFSQIAIPSDDKLLQPKRATSPSILQTLKPSGNDVTREIPKAASSAKKWGRGANKPLGAPVPPKDSKPQQPQLQQQAVHDPWGADDDDEAFLQEPQLLNLLSQAEGTPETKVAAPTCTPLEIEAKRLLAKQRLQAKRLREQRSKGLALQPRPSATAPGPAHLPPVKRAKP